VTGPRVRDHQGRRAGRGRLSAPPGSALRVEGRGPPGVFARRPACGLGERQRRQVRGSRGCRSVRPGRGGCCTFLKTGVEETCVTPRHSARDPLPRPVTCRRSPGPQRPRRKELARCRQRARLRPRLRLRCLRPRRFPRAGGVVGGRRSWRPRRRCRRRRAVAPPPPSVAGGRPGGRASAVRPRLPVPPVPPGAPAPSSGAAVTTLGAAALRLGGVDGRGCRPPSPRRSLSVPGQLVVLEQLGHERPPYLRRVRGRRRPGLAPGTRSSWA